MKKILLSAIMIGALQAEGLGTLFSQGEKNFGFGLSSGTSFNSNYTIVSASFNYFIQNNISAGVGYQGWFGGDPKINEISIPVTYYHPFTEQYHPYVGFIYRHTFIDSDTIDDYNVYGGRIGVAMTMGGNSYAQFGWVQEHRTNGDYSSDEGYPEISMGFVF